MLKKAWQNAFVRVCMIAQSCKNTSVPKNALEHFYRDIDLLYRFRKPCHFRMLIMRIFNLVLPFPSGASYLFSGGPLDVNWIMAHFDICSMPQEVVRKDRVLFPIFRRMIFDWVWPTYTGPASGVSVKGAPAMPYLVDRPFPFLEKIFQHGPHLDVRTAVAPACHWRRRIHWLSKMRKDFYSPESGIKIQSREKVCAEELPIEGDTTDTDHDVKNSTTTFSRVLISSGIDFDPPLISHPTIVDACVVRERSHLDFLERHIPDVWENGVLSQDPDAPCEVEQTDSD